MQDFVSPIKCCLEAYTGLFCYFPQAHSMNHADDILAELIKLLDVCNAGLGDLGKSLLAANAQVPPIMFVGSVPTWRRFHNEHSEEIPGHAYPF